MIITPESSPAAALHDGNSGPPFDCTITAGAGAASGKTVSPVDSTEMIVLKNKNIGCDRLNRLIPVIKLEAILDEAILSNSRFVFITFYWC